MLAENYLPHAEHYNDYHDVRGAKRSALGRAMNGAGRIAIRGDGRTFPSTIWTGRHFVPYSRARSRSRAGPRY